MRKRFQSGLTGLLFGGLWGGLVGAILLGLHTYFDDSSSLVGGAARNWVWLFAIFGFVGGLVVGALLGAVIGVTHANQRTGVIIGLTIGALMFVALVYDCYDCVDPLIFAVIISCSILGWLVSRTIQVRDQSR